VSELLVGRGCRVSKVSSIYSTKNEHKNIDYLKMTLAISLFLVRALLGVQSLKSQLATKFTKSYNSRAPSFSFALFFSLEGGL